MEEVKDEEKPVELGYASAEGWTALCRPAGVAVLIWAILGLGAVTVLTVMLVGGMILMIVRSEKDLGMLLFSINVSLVISGVLYFRLIQLVHWGQKLMEQKAVNEEPLATSFAAIAAFLAIVSGIVTTMLILEPGISVIVACAGLWIFTAGVWHTRRLLVRLRKARLKQEEG